MKKKLLSFMLAFCLIIPCALALTACGGEAKPFSVAGKTLKGTSEIHLVWKDGTTEEEKEELFSNADVTNEQEFKEILRTESEYGRLPLATFEYKEDESFIQKITNIDGTPFQADSTYYYTQSEDLKTISMYLDAGHTKVFGSLIFYKGSYCLVVSELSVVSFYFVFKKA